MKLKITTIAISILLGVPTFAQATKPAANPQLPSEQTVNEFMRHMFGYDPSLKWQVSKIDVSPEGMPEVYVVVQNGQVSQTMRFFVMPDGKHAISGEIIPFSTDPFASTRAVLAKADGPAKGPANAAVTIIEFGDLECPSCKQAQPVVDKLLADNPDVHFIFQNFPLTQIHPWAFRASSFADCIARSNAAAFWKFAQITYDAQSTITPENADTRLTELANLSGADGAKIAGCAVTPETKARVEASLQLGIDAGVTGTPTLFINGRKVQNVTGTPYEVLNRMAKFTPDAK